MLELNEQIAWTPEHIQQGIFGKWLENARDWSITRNRFWGSPVPVWKSDNPQCPRIDVYGSVAELQRDFGVEVTDLHRPFIDELTRPNPDDPTGQSTMRRVEDVMDVWVDSGSMPYAQVHYPFENQEWFEHHYPGDFIVEYIGQTRGWFYTLHVLATALFDRPAFKTAVSHGIVLGSDGRKMSKSLKNYPDVREVFDRDGSDAMRWFLMASPILRGGNLIVTEEGIRDAVRQALLPMWSTYYFFTLYANAARMQNRACSCFAEGKAGVDKRSEEHANAARMQNRAGYTATAITADRVPSLPALDRYILAKTHDLVAATMAQLDAYDIAGACESVRVYLDVLTNWYVRTQRDRFWQEDVDAFDTLYTVLETLCRVAAPLAPLLTEEIWRGLTGGRSVHLTDWPPIDALLPDDALVAAMDQVRAVVSTALSLRKANKLRVRQPLARLTVAVENPVALADYVNLLRTELNVKDVELVLADETAAERFGIIERLAVNARAAGPRLGRGVQAAIKAAKAGAWTRDASGTVVITTEDGPVPLLETEYTLETITTSSCANANESPDLDAAPALAAAVLPAGGFVVLDLALTPELEAEGYARDAIRDIQDARKAAGLAVADRIDLTLGVPSQKIAAIESHRDLVMAETLAVSLTITPSDAATRQIQVTRAG
ncbi:MAG: class I tRNA ligase family protein, partial [Promicromonosporaceae bacterium]|nr:class I tRNA ligase family protein [Promicromonosporaceae bacterium]